MSLLLTFFVDTEGCCSGGGQRSVGRVGSEMYDLPPSAIPVARTNLNLQGLAMDTRATIRGILSTSTRRMMSGVARTSSMSG